MVPPKLFGRCCPCYGADCCKQDTFVELTDVSAHSEQYGGDGAFRQASRDLAGMLNNRSPDNQPFGQRAWTMSAVPAHTAQGLAEVAALLADDNQRRNNAQPESCCLDIPGAGGFRRKCSPRSGL